MVVTRSLRRGPPSRLAGMTWNSNGCEPEGQRLANAVLLAALPARRSDARRSRNLTPTNERGERSVVYRA
jgi:hypothetical protein